MPPPSPTDEAVLAMDAALDVDAAGILEVDVPGAHVQLRPPSEGNRVRVQGFVPGGDAEQARALFERRGIATHQARNRLYVFGKSPSSDAENWRWRRLSQATPHLDIQLPSSMDVEAHTPGGAVEATGLSGSLELTVWGGAVELDDLQGALQVRGGGGPLAARNCSPPRADLQWAAGRLALEHVSAESITLRAKAVPTTLQNLRGSVDLSVKGASAFLRDVEGPCEAQVWGGSLTYRGAPTHETVLTTVGAPLNTSLPASYGASLALTGKQVFLDEDFPFEGERTPHRIEGTLNGGGPALRLQAIRDQVHCSSH